MHGWAPPSVSGSIVLKGGPGFAVAGFPGDADANVQKTTSIDLGTTVNYYF